MNVCRWGTFYFRHTISKWIPLGNYKNCMQKVNILTSYSFSTIEFYRWIESFPDYILQYPVSSDSEENKVKTLIFSNHSMWSLVMSVRTWLSLFSPSSNISIFSLSCSFTITNYVLPLHSNGTLLYCNATLSIHTSLTMNTLDQLQKCISYPNLLGGRKTTVLLQY